MKPTDEDRAALADETKDYLETPWRDINSALDAAYVAGKLDGAEAMRERAAKVCEDYASVKWTEYKHGSGPGRANPQWQGESDGAHDCAAAIRALEVDDE